MKRGMILLMSWLLCSQLFATQYKTFEENGKVGMKNDKDQVILPPSFEALGWSDGSFSVIGEVTGYRLNGHWGIINLKKEYVTRAEFLNLVYSGGESIVAQKKISDLFLKKGCLNLQGEIKIPFIYDGIIVQSLRAIVFNLTQSGFQYGLVDLNNKSILPMSYKYIKPLGSLRYAVENVESKIALFSEEGKPITDFSIDSVSNFYKGFSIVYQNHLQGLIDREGTNKLEVKYQLIKIDENGKVFGKLPNEWTFLTDKNDKINSVFAEELKSDGKKFFFIKKGNKWGVVSDKMESVIPNYYDEITEISDDRYIVKRNSKTGVIDSKGKIIISLEYDSLKPVEDRFIAHRLQGWHLLDESGTILTSHFYDSLTLMGTQQFLVRSKGYWGILNSEGKEFVHCVFDSIANQKNNLVAVKFKGKYGIINVNEDWVVTLQDFPVRVVNDKAYLQKQPGNQFVRMYDGSIRYFSPYPLRFEKDYFIETLPNGTEKLISYEGLIIQRTPIPESTEEVFRESEGLVGIKKNGRYGFVDLSGRLRIANRYDSIGEFHEGLAPVKLIGRWGFVNTSDQIAINPNYDRPTNFQSGITVVSRNGKFGLINKEGKIILPLRYDNVVRDTDKFLITASGLEGIADSQGNVTIEPRFDSLVKTENNLFVVGRDAKFGVITEQGLGVIPIIYDQLIYNPVKKVFLAEKKSDLKEIAID